MGSIVNEQQQLKKTKWDSPVMFTLTKTIQLINCTLYNVLFSTVKCYIGVICIK